MAIKIISTGFKIVAYQIVPLVRFAVKCDTCGQVNPNEVLPEEEVKQMGDMPHQCSYCQRVYPIYKDEQSFAQLVEKEVQ